MRRKWRSTPTANDIEEANCKEKARGPNANAYFRFQRLILHVASVAVAFIAGRNRSTACSNPAVKQNDLQTQIRDGWRTVHVFGGAPNLIIDEIRKHKWGYAGSRGITSASTHKLLSSGEGVDGERNDPFGNWTVRWYAEHGQDIAVSKFFDFKRDGYFVDLAAHIPHRSSNTFSLGRHYGWTGICIEPNELFWNDLAVLREDCHVAGALVGQQRMEKVTFRANNTKAGLAGIVGLTAYNNGTRPIDRERYTTTLVEILQMLHAPSVIDYLSLDIEGAEEFVLANFPFDSYKFLTMSIERPSNNLTSFLLEKGYKLAFEFNRGDTLWAHQSVHEDGKKRLDKNPEDIKKHSVLDLPPLLS